IVIGLAIDIDDVEIYGPVLDSAYRLESRVAGGPRIAVGNSCLEYLRFVQRRGHHDVHHGVAASIASWCLGMLRYDYDGVLTLDPLGDQMLAVSRSSAATLVDRVAPAHAVVRRQLAEATSRGDEKLMAR